MEQNKKQACSNLKVILRSFGGQSASQVLNQEKIRTLAQFKVPNTNNFLTLEVNLSSFEAIKRSKCNFWRDQSSSLDKLWSTTKTGLWLNFKCQTHPEFNLGSLEVILRSCGGQSANSFASSK